MQLHNRLSNLFQKETGKLLKSFLNDNPDLLKKYVNGSVAAIGAILGPVNVFMRHLLTVQGLDPNSVPGETQRLQMQEALHNFFSGSHDKDFDDDYDFSWVEKKFKEARSGLGQLELSKENFKKITDLSNWGSSRYPTADEEQEFLLNRVIPEPVKKEIPLDPPKVAFDPGNPIDALRDAVKSIEKEVDLNKKKKVVKAGKRKLNKTTTPPKKVRRVANTEPAKEGPSTLQVDSDRVVRPSSKRTPGRNLRDIATDRRTQAKIAKESTPKFQAQLKVKLARATALTNLMVEKGLCDVDDKSRQDQINSMLTWGDNNFEALERVITKYGPTKDAVAENKFKGSFRRVVK